MQPPPINPSRLVVPVLILSLASCGGGMVSRQPGPEPGGSLRPFAPLREDRGSYHGVCYGPHRDGQRPGGATPTAAEIREDLSLMAAHWNLLRTYGASEFARTLLEEIRGGGYDLKVVLGVWIAAEEERDEAGALVRRLPAAAAANLREGDAAIALAREFPDVVVAVCVGNETQVSWSPYPCPLDLLIAHVRRVRAAVAVPVTAADDYQYWLTPESRTLAREVDFLTVHAHPLWNGRQLTEGMPWLREQLSGVAARHPDRPAVIGETGWATSVADVGEEARLIRGAAGESEQAAFHGALRGWAAAERELVFVFEAFDENWKGGDDPAEVEKHWGLFRADRTAKLAVRTLAGP